MGRRGKHSRFSDSLLRELYVKYNGKHAAIARELGVSREAIRQRLSPKGLNATHGKKERMALTES